MSERAASNSTYGFGNISREGYIPEFDGAVRVHCAEELSVGAIRHLASCKRSREQPARLAFKQGADLGVGGDVPEPDWAGNAPGSQGLSIRTEGHSGQGWGAIRGHERPDPGVTGHVPQLDCAAPRRGGEGLAIRAECDVRSAFLKAKPVLGCPDQRSEPSMGSHVPQLDYAANTVGGERLAVRAERDGASIVDAEGKGSSHRAVGS